jgi:preprotein translocase SecF subunit
MRFIANRKKFYLVSGIGFLVSFLVFFFVPKNYGIDMTGGLQIEYTTTQNIDEWKLHEIREDITKNYLFDSRSVISDILIYTVDTHSIRVDIGLNEEKDVKKSQKRTEDMRRVLPIFFQKHDISVSESVFVSVGQSFGKFVIDRAYLTLTMCLIAIALYLMYAFRQSIQGTSSFTFGAITLVTLLHDIIIAPGIFILLWLVFPELKIDTFFVTAILTTLGYSINDTIVILDRIRANYKDKKSSDKRTTKQIFEDSIQVSLRRSLYTSMTLVMILVVMLFFWPSALIGFTTLMLLGAIIGTYSSICIAAPLLYDINKNI